jgi:hypothetical protein
MASTIATSATPAHSASIFPPCANSCAKANSPPASSLPKTPPQRHGFVPLAASAAKYPPANLAAFEPRRHEGFANKPGEPLYVAPYEPGNHGWWPGLADYRAGYVLWGRGISPRRTPALPMESVAARLAALLGVKLER